MTGLSAAHAAPANHAAAITPSDSTALATPSRFLVAGVAGNVKVDTLGGETAVVVYLGLGYHLPLRVTKIYATGTTATGIVSLW